MGVNNYKFQMIRILFAEFVYWRTFVEITYNVHGLFLFDSMDIYVTRK